MSPNPYPWTSHPISPIPLSQCFVIPVIPIQLQPQLSLAPPAPPEPSTKLLSNHPSANPSSSIWTLETNAETPPAILSTWASPKAPLTQGHNLSQLNIQSKPPTSKEFAYALLQFAEHNYQPL